MGVVEGRVALVTGAARGQGRAHAIALATEGADIVVTDLCADIATVPYALGTAAELAETVALVEATGQRCLSMPADIRDTAGIGLVVEAGIEAFGQIDTDPSRSAGDQSDTVGHRHVLAAGGNLRRSEGSGVARWIFERA